LLTVIAVIGPGAITPESDIIIVLNKKDKNIFKPLRIPSRIFYKL
jgi:hypothetical protein